MGKLYRCLKEVVKLADMYAKKRPPSSVTVEMQVRTAQRLHPTQSEWLFKSQNPSAGEKMGAKELS